MNKVGGAWMMEYGYDRVSSRDQNEVLMRYCQ